MAGNYDTGFYADQRGGSARSASIVLPILFDAFAPKSVCDVGCGVGTWLAEAKRLGATVAVGVDGEWARSATLADPTLDVRSVDLEKPIALSERFDLAMSLEVAEHLSGQRAPGLVRELCSLADYVLFSAAIPGQGGEHHINEQWQSYWGDFFKAEGFTALDAIRPRVWENANVEWWYRQNTLLYVKNDRVADARARLGLGDVMPMMDVVHPIMNNVKHIGFGTMLRALPAALWMAVKRRLPRSIPAA